MKAIMIVNGFLKGTKYSQLSDLTVSAFKKYGIDLEIMTNDEVCQEINKCTVKTDFVLFWDKDTVLAKRLENLGFSVFNSSRAIEICDNKGLTAVMLENSGINMPKTFVAPFTFENIGYNDYTFVEKAVKTLGYPLVIKESYGSFGQQVYLASNEEELKSILNKIGSKPFIMQEYIKETFGKDVRIEVVGGKAVASVMRIAKEGDFRANVTNGGSMQKYNAPKEFTDMAERVAEIIGCDFAGVDILFGKDGKPVFCEINSNAHFKNLLDTTGVNVAEIIAKYIKEKIC